jgi:hypothetical protein
MLIQHDLRARIIFILKLSLSNFKLWKFYQITWPSINFLKETRPSTRVTLADIWRAYIYNLYEVNRSFLCFLRVIFQQWSRANMQTMHVTLLDLLRLAIHAYNTHSATRLVKLSREWNWRMFISLFSITFSALIQLLMKGHSKYYTSHAYLARWQHRNFRISFSGTCFHLSILLFVFCNAIEKRRKLESFKRAMYYGIPYRWELYLIWSFTAMQLVHTFVCQPQAIMRFAYFRLLPTSIIRRNGQIVF